MQRVTAGQPSAGTRVLSGIALLAVAATLRPVITALGPVLDLVGRDTGLGAGALGLLGAVPLLAFALVSPFVNLLSRRFGPDKTVLGASVALLVGTVVRSLPGGTASLWAGTITLGAAIAVGNVLVLALLKRDFPDHLPVATGAYSAVLSGSAAFATGLALPLALLVGWRWSIGCWALLSVAATVLWAVRLRTVSGRPTLAAPPAGSPSMWSSRVAWLVTLLMATQATTFYALVTWLPAIQVASGIDPVTAGWYVFWFQIAGIAAGLGVTPFLRGRTDHRLVGAVISLLLIVALAGLLAEPSLALLWLVLAGLSSGSALVLALALIGERARDAYDAGRLSGMAQSVGYLLAAAGPVGAGLLFQLTGGWTAAVVAVMAVAGLQCVLALSVGRPAFTHPPRVELDLPAHPAA